MLIDSIELKGYGIFGVPLPFLQLEDAIEKSNTLRSDLDGASWRQRGF